VDRSDGKWIGECAQPVINIAETIFSQIDGVTAECDIRFLENRGDHKFSFGAAVPFRLRTGAGGSKSIGASCRDEPTSWPRKNPSPTLIHDFE